MSCLSNTTKARIQAQIVKLDAILAAAYAALESGAGTDIKEYRFDSGEGSQRTEYKSLSEMMELIDSLEARVSALQRRLNGTGLVTMNLRRKSYGRCG